MRKHPVGLPIIEASSLHFFCSFLLLLLINSNCLYFRSTSNIQGLLEEEEGGGSDVSKVDGNALNETAEKGNDIM